MSKKSRDNSKTLTAFDELVAGPVAKFLGLCDKIGGDVQTQGNLVKTCFASERDIIQLSLTHRKPTESDLKDIMNHCAAHINSVVNFRDSKRSSSLFNNLSAVSESIVSLAWVSVQTNPVSYVKSIQEACQFYVNRVIKDNKETNPVQAEWARSLSAILVALIGYIKEFHEHGLAWSAEGPVATAAALKGGASPPSNAGSAPIPPPPPPPPKPVFGDAPVRSTDDGRGALFADLNRGNAVTAGLRKVTDDMKTHKNPQLRVHSPVPASKANGQTKPAAAKQASPVKQQQQQQQTNKGKLDLQGNKWVVEYFNGQALTVTATETKQTVYVYNCNNCTITVRGKLNSIMLDLCKKTGVVFDDLISSLDVVNCQSVAVQSMGKLSTVNIDKTDGCQVYLNEQSKFCDVITAKSSEVNVVVPQEDGEMGEFAVPEQLKSQFNGKSLSTSVVKQL